MAISLNDIQWPSFREQHFPIKQFRLYFLCLGYFCRTDNCKSGIRELIHNFLRWTWVWRCDNECEWKQRCYILFMGKRLKDLILGLYIRTCWHALLSHRLSLLLGSKSNRLLALQSWNLIFIQRLWHILRDFCDKLTVWLVKNQVHYLNYNLNHWV